MIRDPVFNFSGEGHGAEENWAKSPNLALRAKEFFVSRLSWERNLLINKSYIGMIHGTSLA